MRGEKKFLVMVSILLLCGLIQPKLICNAAENSLEGQGTVSSPYLINSADDILLLSESVNAGNLYAGSYFRQMGDIDLKEYDNWTAIGKIGSNTGFLGTYDGNGYSILNLNICENQSAFFGYLDGTVMNLGIESGAITGDYSGGIAVTTSARARIVNCYSKIGNPNAAHVGSISYDFNGTMVNSCSELDEEDTATYGLCYGGFGKIISGYSTAENLTAQEIFSGELEKSSEQVSAAQMNDNLWQLIIGNGLHCNQLFMWKKMEDGSIGFGDSYTEKYWDTKEVQLKGKGSKDNPYKIETVSDLIYLREKIFTGAMYYKDYFEQSQDLNLAECGNWIPIAEINVGVSFRGIYNGAGHTITNLTIDRPVYGGMFGSVSGRIENLGIEYSKITGEFSGGIAVVLEKEGKIINCYSKAGSETSSNTGSIVYNLLGTVTNCYGSPAANSFSTGISVLGTGKIENSYSTKKMYDKTIFRGRAVNSEKSEDITAIQKSLNENLIAVSGKEQVAIDRLCTWSEKKEIAFSGEWHWNINNVLKFVAYYIQKLLIVKLLLAVTIFWAVVGAIRICCFKKVQAARFAEKLKKSCGEYLIIASIVLLFWDTFIYYKGIKEFGWLQWVYTFLLHSAWLFFFGTYLQRRQKTEILQRLKKHSVLLLLMAVVMIIGISHFHIFSMFDANLYYGEFIKSMDGFQFTIGSFLTSFLVWGSPLQGPAIFMSIGECFYPGTAQGVYAVNLMLLIAAMGCCYSIIRNLFDKLSGKTAAVLTFCFALLPGMLGLTTYINPDFYAAVFFVYLVYCYLKGLDILFGFCTFLFIFTKVNMTLSYALFLGIVLLYEVIQYQGKWFRRLQKLFQERPLFCWTLPLYVYIWLKFVVAPMDIITSSTAVPIDYLQNTLNRIGQYFVFGFKWLIFGIAIIVVIILICRKSQFHIRNIFTTKRKAVFLAVMMGSLAQLGVLLCIRNSLCPRYTTISTLSLILIFAASIEYLRQCGVIKNIMLFGTAGLMFIQLFYTVDPTIITWGKPYKLENKTLYALCNVNYAFRDVYVYNYEYSVYSDLVDDMLENLNLEEEALFYVEGDSEEVMITGNVMYPIYWDLDKKIRSYTEGADTVKIESASITSEELLAKFSLNHQRKDTIYLVETDFSEGKVKKELEKFGYYMEGTVESKNEATSLKCYKLSRLKQEQ